MNKIIVYSVLTIIISLSAVSLSFGQENTFYDVKKKVFLEDSKLAPNEKMRNKWLRRIIYENQTRYQDAPKEVLQDYIDTRLKNYNHKREAELLDLQSAWSPLPSLENAQHSNPKFEEGVGRMNTITYHPNKPNIMIAAAPHGGIWKTTNAAETWYPVGDDLYNMKVSQVAYDPSNPNILYAATGDYAYIAINVLERGRHSCFGEGIIKSTDGGETWFPTSLEMNQLDKESSILGFVAVHQSNGSVIAAGAKGIFKSTDGGKTWDKKNDKFIWDLDQHPTEPNTIFATSGSIPEYGIDDKGIWKSTNFGDTWTELEYNQITNEYTGRIELAISPSNPNIMYALATINKIQGSGLNNFSISTDGGKTWNKTIQFKPNILGWDKKGISNTTVYQGQGLYDLAMVVDTKDPNIVYTGGINIWKTTDGGINWKPASLLMNNCVIHCDIHDISVNPHTGEYFVCCDGGIFKTDSINEFTYSNNTNWKKMCGNLANNEFYRIGIHRDNSSYIAGGCQDNSCYYIHNDNITNMFMGDGFETIIHPTDPKIVYGCSQGGNPFVSYDYGNNHFPMRVFPYDNAAWCAPFIMDEENPNTLYLAKSQVYKYDAYTDQVMGISNFPKDIMGYYGRVIYAMEMCRTNTNYIYLSKAPAHEYDLHESSLYMTSDAGKSWEDVTAGLPAKECYFNYITVDDNDPEHVWVAMSHYYDGIKVYETKNSGATWENISFNLPNVPINCVRHQPGSKYNIVYAATELGIWYKSDNMNEWKSYSNNLPNVICTEIEIDTKQNKLFTSTFGRGIWVTDLLTDDDVSVRDEIHQSHIVVSPNPANSNFNLKIEGITPQELTIQIVDVIGRVCHEQKEFINEHQSLAMNTNLQSGVYYIRLISKDGFTKSTQLRIK